MSPYRIPATPEPEALPTPYRLGNFWEGVFCLMFWACALGGSVLLATLRWPPW